MNCTDVSHDTNKNEQYVVDASFVYKKRSAIFHDAPTCILVFLYSCRLVVFNYIAAEIKNVAATAMIAYNSGKAAKIKVLPKTS